MLSFFLWKDAHTTVTIFTIPAGSCGGAVGFLAGGSSSQHQDATLASPTSISLFSTLSISKYEISERPFWVYLSSFTLHFSFWFQTPFRLRRYTFFVLVPTVLPRWHLAGQAGCLPCHYIHYSGKGYTVTSPAFSTFTSTHFTFTTRILMFSPISSSQLILHW